MSVCHVTRLKEECRRVRALLREAESRCRGLQDQVEESRARERRASADAEDERRRAAADAGEPLLVIFSIDSVGGVLYGVHDGDGRARAQSGRNVADQGGFLSSQAQIGDMRGTCTLENVA